MAVIIAKRYKLIKRIGSGGMADVYLALDTILNREVAIKVLKSTMSGDKNAVTRFAREANASTCLSHPNIVDIYDVGQDGNHYFIVMEYVKGYTLKELINKRGALPPKEAVWVMKQLSSALMEAHRNNIIHRDIKSQNVIIKNDGTVKLSDFGIALANDAMQITAEDSILGSVHYLAPELVKGNVATMQSDIYALGIVFYELLTGDVPFKGENSAQVALEQVRGVLPSVRSFNPQIPQSVENIVIKATAKDLENRYKNIALMVKDLNDCFKLEHKDDAKVDIDQSLERKASDYVHVSKTHDKKVEEKKLKNEKRFSFVYIFAITLLSALLLVGVLFISGIIKIGSNMVKVPDLNNLSLLEAGDLLEKYNLSIDFGSIERQMTDDIDTGLIINYYPGFDEEVEKGTKIKVVVSEGKYAIMDSFVGQNINDVKELLTKKNFIVSINAVSSNEPAGTIIAQEGLVAGDKYNPNIANYITLTYSEYKMMVIPFSTKGRMVEDVAYEFRQEGFNVETVKLHYSEFSEEELNKYLPFTVVRISPDEGSSYTQENDNVIYLYYYE